MEFALKKESRSNDPTPACTRMIDLLSDYPESSSYFKVTEQRGASISTQKVAGFRKVTGRFPASPACLGEREEDTYRIVSLSPVEYSCVSVDNKGDKFGNRLL